MAGEGVRVSHEAMQQQAQRLAQKKNDIEAQLQEAQGQIQELISGGFSTEAASISFGEAYERWNTAARATVGELELMGQYLGKASAAFKDLDQSFTVKI